MSIKSENFLAGYDEKEKAAYIGALASLATADREATPEELENLHALALAAGISDQQEQKIIHSARDITGQDLKRCLDQLKASDLRYSLITDLIAMAKADESYTDEERKNIEKVSDYLEVNRDQFSVLDQYVSRAVESEQPPEEVAKPGFLESIGLKEQFTNAGFSDQSMARSLFGFLGPMILGGMAAKTLGRNRNASSMGGAMGGGLGGILGSVLGGNSPMTRSMPRGMSGGLGSILKGMVQSRGNQSLGGLLKRLG